MDFDWKSVVGTIAPTIAGAIGGPLAGVAVATIGKALGLSSDSSESDVSLAMQNLSSDQILALKKADIDFRATLATLVVQDKASAREREIKAGGSVPELLAKGAILFFLLNILGAFALIWFQVPVQDSGNYLLGACNTGSVALLKNVYDYYFGSNIDALTRDNMIYNSTPTEKAHR